LIEAIVTCKSPGIGLQALALFARGGIRVPDGSTHAARFSAAIPQKHWSARMDILSVDEALEILSQP